MTSPNLWVGFAVAVSLGTLLLCLLLWYKGQERGVPPRRLYLAMAQVAMSVLLAVLIGVALRGVAGGEVVDAGRGSAPLGLWYRPLTAHQLAGVLVGLALIGLCLMWAVRVIRSVTDHEQPNEDGGSDGKC